MFRCAQNSRRENFHSSLQKSQTSVYCETRKQHCAGRAFFFGPFAARQGYYGTVEYAKQKEVTHHDVGKT